jgi:hypothetical protein
MDCCGMGEPARAAVACLTASMCRDTNTTQANLHMHARTQPPLGQRRALFLSGMSGSEVTEVIAAYRCACVCVCVCVCV